MKLLLATYKGGRYYMYLCKIKVNTEIHLLETIKEGKMPKIDVKDKPQSIGYSINYFQNYLRMANKIPVYKINQNVYR